MKTFKNCAAQGELLITKINKLPDNLIAVEPVNNEYIVAHSETGHHHVVEATNTFLYSPANDDDMNGLQSYLVVDQPVSLRHLRNFDTHTPIGIEPGMYSINHAREYVPNGYRKVSD